MRKILLTRLVADNDEDKRYFEQLGYQCIEQPLLELSLHQAASTSLQAMEQAEWLFLTSQHSAAFFLQLFLAQYSFSFLQKKKFAVIGEKTAVVLEKAGLYPNFQSRSATKRGLFTEWLASYKEPTTIFYPKSSLADSRWEEAFSVQGHHFQTGIVYDNRFSENQKSALQQLLNDSTIDAVYFTSLSLWQRFYAVYSQINAKTELKFYCVGQTTQEVIQKSGYHAVIKK
ncbi:uroporphyrinogen-III synthase [Candidatus Enterococcus clewellii]|uniref:Uroporphyrinogen-III synthase n=1 Tax=Candidatus Enterococcus clewellii TaxID=1834193 RepID=A0A242K5B0_9ENTE|nr:uroporphyrinogen-III synthase [Enterococcus sp. 9E7_DIV0242]OTP14613.1 hypothetical protein A5888_002714 [Enterococcus sp. 9E7_DIV0242]